MIETLGIIVFAIWIVFALVGVPLLTSRYEIKGKNC